MSLASGRVRVESTSAANVRAEERPRRAELSLNSADGLTSSVVVRFPGAFLLGSALTDDVSRVDAFKVKSVKFVDAPTSRATGVMGEDRGWRTRGKDGQHGEALTFTELVTLMFGELRELAAGLGSISVNHEVLDRFALLEE